MECGLCLESGDPMALGCGHFFCKGNMFLEYVCMFRCKMIQRNGL